MNDLIRRSDAVKAIHDDYDEWLVVDTDGRWIADDIENVLDNVKTIEAIPVGWIYEYFSDAEKERERREKEYGGPLTEAAMKDTEYSKLVCVLAVMRFMIAEWRKVAKEWDNVST